MSFVSLVEWWSAAALVSAVLAGLFWLWLRHRAARWPQSKGSVRQGGLIPLILIGFAWSALSVLDLAPIETLMAIVGAGVLAWLGWPFGGFKPERYIRFAIECGAVVLGCIFVPGRGHIFQGLVPPFADLLLTAILWLWFIHLWGSLDAVDGLAGSQTLLVGFGAAGIAFAAADHETGAATLGLSLAAVLAGFLVWNWPPARLRLGAIGALPLGFLVFWILLGLAGRGYWAPAIILPLAALADGVATLARRVARFQLPWGTHRDHVFQMAARRFAEPGPVVLRLAGGTLGLALTAALAVPFRWIGLPIALAGTVALLIWLGRRPEAGAAQP